MEYSIREWQLYELDILKKVVEICEKYNIQYYLSSGTLLGAVRHKGFIPWDDDIDLDMPIGEFKKFCKVPSYEFENRGLFLQTYKTDSEFNEMWAIVRANNTTSMPIKDIKWNIHWGAHIDIFPLVGLYKNEKFRRLQNKLFNLNRSLLGKHRYLSGVDKGYVPSQKLRMIYKLPTWFLHFIVDLNSIFVNHQFSKDAAAAHIWYKLNCNVDGRFYEQSTNLDFEDGSYNCPMDYDGALTMLFGDYMTPPPENQRNGHEGLMGDIIRDLDKDYK